MWGGESRHDVPNPYSDGLNVYFYALTAQFGSWFVRVALVLPQERGSKRAAQRFRQRTPAMAAGKTARRWRAREVLSCPLPPGSG